MRILHVNKFLYRRGGTETYMFDLASLQEGRGDEVAFFGMDHPNNAPMLYAPHFPSYVDFKGPPTAILSRLTAASRMFYSRTAELGIEAVLKDFRPNVVHLHNIYHQLSPSVLRPIARAGIPSVMTLHDYKLACPTYQFLDHGKLCEACLGGHFYHAASRRCKDGSFAASLLVAAESYAHAITRAYSSIQLLIAPSRFLAAKMKEAGVFPERLRVLNNFVESAQIPAKDGAGGPFVFAGRLAFEKGVDVLIKAAALVPGTNVEAFGAGPERAELERLANRIAPGQVRFHGQVDKANLLRAMREATAVVVPSRWYENQPMAILEAFACGVPVLGTSLGGSPELVANGETGFIVAPDNPSALAARIGQLSRDPDLCGRMGRKAREFVVTHHSPGSHLARIGDLYGEAGAAVRQTMT